MENNDRSSATSGGVGEAAMDTGDWRDQLQSESRKQAVNKIKETLKRNIEDEMEKIAVLFEKKIYTAATSHIDYIEKISLELMALECNPQSTCSGSANESKQPDQGAFVNTLMTNLPSQGQQSHTQLAGHQLMSRIRSLLALVQQQMSLQEEKSKILKLYLQQRHQASGQASQAQNVVDRQKQLYYQQQRAIKETPTNSTVVETGHSNEVEWQEEAYQKLKQMEAAYFPPLNEMYLTIAAKIQQHDSHPQQPNSAQIEKLKIFKSMMERILSLLQMSKSDIQPGFKEKLCSYEKQIINFINTNAPRKLVPMSSSQQVSSMASTAP